MDDESAGRPPEEEAGPPQEGVEPGTGPAEPGADDVTRVMADDSAAPTGVMPGAADDATRVMAGDTAAPTTAMPAAGAAAPPPPPRGPQPTLVMSSSRPPKESSSTGWIIVVVILAVLAAAALAWYFLIRDQGSTPVPTPTPTAAAFDWVGAWAPTDGSGGGIVVQDSSGQYQVTVYDTMVRVIGSSTASTKGRNLTFQLETSESLAGIPGPYTVTLTPGSAADQVSMSVTGSNGTTITMPLERVPALVPVTPSSSPSPSASPSLSPSSSPSVSPSPTQSGTDQQVIDGINRIQAGVMTWSANNNNLYPQPGDVNASGGVAQYVNPWPTNPYTGQPMKPGTGPGEYTYQQLNGGAGYQITGYVSGGLTYTVP
jgi:hypothetical protein